MSLPPPTRQDARPVAWAPEDDVPLVHAAQGGDAASFDTLYRRHARLVHAVLLGRATGDDVEDLVQEVFLAAWRRLATLRDPAAFGGWVVTIARHQRIDHVRRQAARPDAVPRRTGPDGGDERRPELRSADVPADARLEAHQALDAIRALPEAYRETLLLRLVEGMTGPEIARRTGLTPESVRVNLCRGMKLLRQALAHAPAVRMT
ncbi:sigma-70 family RNA polymerase sigma factor [Luteitalea sp.]|uniref:RNA polymerase sigma factor n=1 Tax=Luteitalea sp. TaxID=2004800 RepID=UPI0025BAE767|nr:sigma-70 family RNA polymerase sigma factor [Luteitalea sp.]